jgi:SM-20-related protein
MNEVFEILISQLIEKGYAVLDDFLPKPLVKKLAENLRIRFKEGEMKAAGVGRQSQFKKDESYRSDVISWVDNDTEDADEQEFLKLIEGLMFYLNRTCFTSLKSYEFHYAMYKQGTFYKRHLDQFTSDSRRQFSVVSYLNEDWGPEDGGELVLYTNSEPVTVLPKGGRIVFFKSDLLEHEVKTAFRERLSLTGWIKN